MHPAPFTQDPNQPGDPVGAMPGPSSPLCALSHPTAEVRGPCVHDLALRLWKHGSAPSQPRCPRALSQDTQRAAQLGLSS